MELKNVRTARTAIEQMANYYGLTPKPLRTKNFGKATAWTRNKAAVHFWYDDKRNVYEFSYDGQAKAAYQLGLNILANKEYQDELGIQL